MIISVNRPEKCAFASCGQPATTHYRSEHGEFKVCGRHALMLYEPGAAVYTARHRGLTVPTASTHGASRPFRPARLTAARAVYAASASTAATTKVVCHSPVPPPNR